MTKENVPTLKRLEGEQVLAMIPFLNSERMDLITLRRVEQHGIWIEHQPSLEKFLNLAGASASPKTPVFFVPWCAVTAILGSWNVPALSNKALL
jgi:hypothetical protein